MFLYPSCKPSNIMSSFTHSPQVFLPCTFYPLHIPPQPPLHFYRTTQNHPHSNAPNVQTTSICHTSPHQPHSEHLEDCTTPYCAFCPSTTLHTSFSSSYVLLSPGSADFQPSLPMRQQEHNHLGVGGQDPSTFSLTSQFNMDRAFNMGVR